MGFSLTRCIEALRHTQSLEHATDYLLQGNDFAAPGQGLGGLDLDLSEEAQMMQAIAMSLGENVVMTTDQVLCRATSRENLPLEVCDQV